ADRPTMILLDIALPTTLTFSSNLTISSGATARPSEDVLALMKRTEELRSLPLPGRPIPSTVAKLVASFVLPETINHAVVPDRVTATSDGGIMFYFFGREHLAGRRYASLEIHEAGEVVMLFSDRETGLMPDVEEVTLLRGALEGALGRIKLFIDP